MDRNGRREVSTPVDTKIAGDVELGNRRAAGHVPFALETVRGMPTGNHEHMAAPSARVPSYKERACWVESGRQDVPVLIE